MNTPIGAYIITFGSIAFVIFSALAVTFGRSKEKKDSVKQDDSEGGNKDGI